MTIKLAALTLSRITTAMEQDQGARFRQLLGEILPTISDAYRGEEPPFRTHLGASLIGRECARELWYGFRWSLEPRHEARILRLFNRGHLEEARFIALLRMIGCEVWTQGEDGKQFRISDHGGHFGGSLDAVVRGLPEMPDVPMLAEFKTHGDKSFTKLVAMGMRMAKPEHYAQMQIYMRKVDLAYGVYFAVNKNDDALHAEIIERDNDVADSRLALAGDIIAREIPPARINDSPSWWQCKFCDYSALCHGDEAPAMNCRTCEHALPIMNGWVCRHHDNCLLSVEQQRSGCAAYTENPAMKA